MTPTPSPALYLKRVATEVSLTQLDDPESPGAAQPSPTPGSLPVANVANGVALATYFYSRLARGASGRPQKFHSSDCAVVPDIDNSSEDEEPRPLSSGSPVPCIPNLCDDDKEADNGEVATSQDAVEVYGVVPCKSQLDIAILAQWEDCADQGLFRYDVTACPTKVVPGMYGFVAQLNEGRATKKRPTEFRVDQVVQDFDEAKFNFKKALMREVLLAFEPSLDSKAHLMDNARATASPNLIMINVSPIEYGHVLLVPRVLDNLQQLVDCSTALMAVRFAIEAANPYFRVGYNSLGAFATINHLHFQAYYLHTPIPCERAPTVSLHGLKRKRGAVRLSALADYPVRGWVLEADTHNGDAVEELGELLGTACLRMQATNVPHNFLITDAGARVFLWPQCYAEKQALGQVPADLLATGVNPASFEISGHLVLKRAEDYESMTQERAWALLEQVSLSEARFQEVTAMCFDSPPL